MAPKRATRATSAATPKTTKKTTTSDSAVSEKLPQLESNINEQCRLFILPKDLSPDARIITLTNPSNKCKSRYFFCPQKGLYEFTKIGSLPRDPRSWLIIRESPTDPPSNDQHMLGSQARQDGYVLQNPDLFLASPVDPIFFLLPLFTCITKDQKASFRLEDDYIEVLNQSSPQLASALRLTGFQDLLIRRLKAVSLVQEFGDDVLFKPDLQRLAKVIMAKARSMTASEVWPASMEEAFVRKQLIVPFTPLLHENLQLPTPEQSMTASDLESQSSNQADDPSEKADLAEKTTVPKRSTSEASPEVEQLMRLRVAIRYITASYMPKDLRDTVITAINDLVDYAPLDAHLQKIEDAKAQIQAQKTLVEKSRKREAMEEEEAALAHAEKRRKKEEEDERQKKTESRGIKQLKKVDTTGMKKLSSFFTKVAPAAKSS